MIGARYYGATFGNDISLDFLSPRDRNGHGSHTASTAAGDHGVTGGHQRRQRRRRIRHGSGRAAGDLQGAVGERRPARPRGATEDIVAAIDDAVADGVDVINYSISGSQTFVVDPVELAFLGAADAGVFVAASAGNSGPRRQHASRTTRRG